MKNNLKAILSAVLILALAMAAIPAFAEIEKGFSAEAVNGSTFTNDYISFTVDSDARLSSYTTAAGDRMIYGKSTGSGNYGNTSYTTVSVNGSRTKFGSNLSVSPAFEGNTNYSAQTVNGVLVEQRLTPVNNDQGEESIVEWRYTYTNNSTSNRSVGCRIMLDTCLGDNDGAPFRLPNNNSITYESQISSNVPRYWFTYSGDMTVQGSFGHDETLPDYLQFANWRYNDAWIGTNYVGLYFTEWNYSVTTSRSIEDSAVAATWTETTLAPGESIDYVMYYGLGDVQQQQYGQLELTLNGDHSVALNDTEDGYVPTPVTLMGILENIGNGIAANAYERIELPAGLTLIGDAAYNAGNIAAGDDATHTWNYTIDEVAYVDRTFTIRVYYGCDGQEEAYAEWVLFVPAAPVPVPELELTLSGDHSVALNASEDGYAPSPVTLTGTIENNGNGTAENAYERIELPEGLTLIGSAAYSAGDIAPGADAEHTWNYTIDEVAYVDRTFTIRVYYGCDGQAEAYEEWTLFVPAAPEPTYPPVISAVHAELRSRPTNDNRADLRFIFKVTFNDAYVTYGGVNYGSGELYSITGFNSEVSTSGSTAVISGSNIYAMFNDGFTFTAVVRGIREANFDTAITAVGHLSYVEVATGIYGSDSTADEPMTYSINDLLN